MEGSVNLKLVVLGEASVGKTSIINAYLGKEISERYLPTIGNKTAKKQYLIKEKDKVLNITLWDAGGQRSFNPFNPAMYEDTDGALLVFDLTKPKETFLNLKKTFLENLNRYSEEVVVLFIGNKLDLVSSSNKLNSTLKELLAKRDHVYLISAKTSEGVNECFELLIYTILKKAELLKPEEVPSNISSTFLNLISKNKEQLKNKLINLSNVDSVLKEVKIKPKIKEESVVEKKVKELKYYDFLRQELDKNEKQKNEITDQFLINISELDKTINHLQKSSGKSVTDLINNLNTLFITAKKDFEVNADLLLKLNREEFELVKIISKVKENQSK